MFALTDPTDETSPSPSTRPAELDLHELKNAHSSIECAFVSDGGGALSGLGLENLPSSTGAQLDVLVASIRTFAQRGFGTPRLCVFDFSPSIIVLGLWSNHPGCFGVVAQGRQALGMVMSKIQRLTTNE